MGAIMNEAAMTSKILVADDSITIQKIVAMAFEHEDTVVEGASNGKDAYNRLAEFRPDIVLADVDMPGINGFDLSKKIKDSPEFSGIPVLLLASDFDEFNNDLFRDSRADDHISKPFKSEEIIEKVKARLQAVSAPVNGQGAPILQADTEGLDDPDEMLFVLSEEHLIEEPGNGLLGSDEPERAAVNFDEDEIDFLKESGNGLLGSDEPERAAVDFDEDEIDFLKESGNGLLGSGEAEQAAVNFDGGKIDFDLGPHLLGEDEASESDALPLKEMSDKEMSDVEGAKSVREEAPSTGSLLDEEWLATLGEDDSLSSGFEGNAAEPSLGEEAFLPGENGHALAGKEKPAEEEPRAETPLPVPAPAAPAPHKFQPSKSFEDLMSLVDKLSHQGKVGVAPAPENKPPKNMPETAAVIDRVIQRVDHLKEATLSEETRSLQSQRGESRAEPATPPAGAGRKTDNAAASPEPEAETRRSPFFAEKTRAQVAPARPEPEVLPEEAPPARKRELKEIARSLEEGPVARLDEEHIKRILEKSLDQAIRKELAGFSEAVLKTIREVVHEVAAEAIKAAVREEMEKIDKWRSE